jgi:hypothetical protein
MPATGLSLVRRVYQNNWRVWHDALTLTDAYMTFPPKSRKFEAPDEMIVPIDVIEENILATEEISVHA